jgi:hypothetical protein
MHTKKSALTGSAQTEAKAVEFEIPEPLWNAVLVRPGE